MAQPIKPFSVSAPGFAGLNLQDAPVDLPASFALHAENVIIDRSGRIAARKGWLKTHTVNADIGTAEVACIGELIEANSTSTILAAANLKLFKLSGSTLVTLTYGGGGVAPTIAADNWQFCQLNGVAMFWQRLHDPLVYDPATSTTTYRRLSEMTAYAGTAYQCNIAISAYGRVWTADNDTDRTTLVWSDILTPQVWTGGTSGSLNLNHVWPLGGDNITAIVAHNNFLIIFGKKQILIYSGATTPTDMTLSDTIVGVGCIARDSVCVTGDDVIFLSAKGVVSLSRTIQEKSAPLSALSKNVLEELQSHAALENTANIKAVYNAVDGQYILTMPMFHELYCFDLKQLLPDGAARVTTWTNISPSSFCAASDKTLYLGQAGYVGRYTGYLDDTAEYRIIYKSTWLDFGAPLQTSILKNIILTMFGATNQSFVVKWSYDFLSTEYSETLQLTGIPTVAEYGVAEWSSGAEYVGLSAVTVLRANGSSSGKVLQFGIEAQINSNNLAIQRIDLYTKDGRI